MDGTENLNEYITEKICGNNLTFLLGDTAQFSEAGYRLLQNYKDNSLVPCMKMQLNGRHQLYYLTYKYRTLSEIAVSTDESVFTAALNNLFESIRTILNNGFFKVENLYAVPEKIYVDPVTLKVYLIYLPLMTGFYKEKISFENEFRTNLARLLLSCTASANEEVRKLLADLQNALLPFEQLVEKMTHRTSDHTSKTNSGRRAGTLYLKTIHTSPEYSLRVDKNEYIVGRSERKADGVISGNDKIGRQHCLITRTDAGYKVRDLKSTNGTSLNNVRLKPEIDMDLTDGDVLRFANLEFRVVMEMD